MALTKTFEKSFRTWMEAQTPEIQAEAAEMLNRAKSGAITPKELSKYQEKYSPKTSAETPLKKKPAAKTPVKTEAPATQTKDPATKTATSKIRSVASNPAAKATADAVKAEASAGAKTAVEEAKTAGKGIGKALNKYVAPAYVGANVFGRGKEIYDDLGKGKTIGEALDKPESNKQVGEAILDTGLALAGMRAGSRFGLPGAVIGSVALPLVGKLGLRATDVAIRGPKNITEAEAPEPKQAPAAPKTPQRRIAFEEINDLAREKGVPFEEAFRQLQRMQTEEINRRAPVEAGEETQDVFVPDSKQSANLAQEAVRAPIGAAPEPDILSFLEQPDTQQMIAELAAKQAQKIQSASNDAGPRRNKKIEKMDELETSSGEERQTNPANVRPPPRFYISTGRFGTVSGAGSRRSPDGRLR